MKTTVTGKHQVSIPAALAWKHGIRPGWRIDWSEGDAPDVLIARIIPDRATPATQLRGAGRRYLRPGVDPVANLVRGRADEDDV